MFPFILGGVLEYFFSELLIIAAILFVLLIVIKVGGFLFKLFFGLIANSILGVIVIYAVNTIFALGIPYSLAVLLPTAIFGLPAVGTIMILKLMGVTLV